MKRRQGRGPRVSCHRPALAALATVFALATVVVTVHTCWAVEALVLRQDDSRIMKFQKMKRVWVQDPDIVDVVVTSYNELLVYSKAIGRTRLIVWDDQARHEFAVQVKPLPAAERIVRELRGILGRNLRYTIVDDGAVLVEGEVRSEAEKERIARVIAAKANGVTIHDLVTVPNPRVTPAEEYQRRFEALFTHPFVYSTIDDDTLVIEGEVVTVADKERMDRIIAAAAGVKVVNLVNCLESRLTLEQQRIAGIKHAVGPNYDYLELDDGVLVISGQADSEQENRRIDKIIAAAAKDVTVVNVVTVKTDTRPPAVRYAETLRPVFGPEYRFTPLGDDGLIIEGIAPTPAEESRIRQILTLVADDLRVVNLVSTGPLTPAERAVAMLGEALGTRYQVRLVGDDVVIVDGVAETSAEKARVDAAVAAADQVKVVNLVAVRAPDAEMWPATRHAEALRPVLGDGLTYRVLDEATLLVEGYVDTAGARARAETIIQALDGAVSFINLIAVRPGPEALTASPADKKAETMARILGPQYTCTVVDERTLMVQGVAPGAAERERIAQIIRSLAGEVTVVDMTVPEEGADTTTPARRASERLRRVVPDELRLIAIDDRTVLIEGTVATSIERERLEKIAETASGAGDVNVLCLVLTQMQAKTPAARRIEGLRRILGDQFNYIVWDEETVLVEGTVHSQDELERVRKILQAADKDWQVADLVTLPAPGVAHAPGADPVLAIVEHLANTIGEPYRVWRVKGNKVVVEGAAPDAEALERLNMLVGAFEDEVEIINLARVAPAPTVSLAARAESLRAVLGEEFQVRTLQGRAIVVEAVMPTKADADRARAIIAAMGMDDVPVVDLVTVADPAVRQVLARVKVLDINRGDLKRLGVNWGQLFGATFADQPFLLSVEGGLGTVGDIAASLDMLRVNDAARILAEPNLVVNEGEEASIVVGGEVPIPVPQVGVGGSSIAIEYKEYGVVLRMKPTINPDGRSLKLSIAPEVSSIDPATQISIGGISVPAFRTRKAETVVDMPDGATLVIGGLIQHDQSKVVRSIPLLGKLPILGELFRSTEWRQGYTELVILVTPEILRTSKP